MEQSDRIFFRRKALQTLRQYWMPRWDAIVLKEQLSLRYTPKYYVESEHLDGHYVKLSGIEFIWYKGALSKGVHLDSGKYYKEPFHFSNIGMGPREMVFPAKILNQLSELTLIGDWTRYQMCLDQPINEDSLECVNFRARKQVRIAVDSIGISRPRVVLNNRYFRDVPKRDTICVEGFILNGKFESMRLLVPLREIHWNSLV